MTIHEAFDLKQSEKYTYCNNMTEILGKLKADKIMSERKLRR